MHHVPGTPGLWTFQCKVRLSIRCSTVLQRNLESSALRRNVIAAVLIIRQPTAYTKPLCMPPCSLVLALAAELQNGSRNLLTGFEAGQWATNVWKPVNRFRPTSKRVDRLRSGSSCESGRNIYICYDPIRNLTRFATGRFFSAYLEELRNPTR